MSLTHWEPACLPSLIRRGVVSELLVTHFWTPRRISLDGCPIMHGGYPISGLLREYFGRFLRLFGLEVEQDQNDQVICGRIACDIYVP